MSEAFGKTAVCGSGWDGSPRSCRRETGSAGSYGEQPLLRFDLRAVSNPALRRVLVQPLLLQKVGCASRTQAGAEDTGHPFTSGSTSSFPGSFHLRVLPLGPSHPLLGVVLSLPHLEAVPGLRPSSPSHLD